MPLSKYQKNNLITRNKEILALHKLGKTTRAIAKDYGLTYQGISYAIKQAQKQEKLELSTS